jgi:DNA-binding transcriptional regulator LsrR (DeoR family)
MGAVKQEFLWSEIFFMRARRGLSSPTELRQMVQCLELHYRQQKPQKEIARALGVSTSKVSRLLKRAFEEGLIRVELDLPQNPRLGAALVQRFGLRDAVVVPAGGRGDLREELGAAAAAYFEKVAANGMAVGLSCGFTLYHLIRHVKERRFRDLTLYPLSGESTLRLVDLSPNTLVGMMAAKYRPYVTAYALPVQHLASLREIERARRRLLRDPEVRRIYEGAQAVDVALVGIGTIAEQTPGFCQLAEAYGVSVRTLRRLGVEGEINYQPFDAQGKVVDRPEIRPLARRMLSVSADRLQALSRQEARHVIAVAGGRAKVSAIRGALRGRLLSVLVTDEDTALALVG